MVDLRRALKDILFWDIYNWTILILIITAGTSAYQLGYADGILPTMLAVITAGTLDTVIKSYKKKSFYVSKSGIISGLFVGVLMAPNLAAVVIAAATAILSKHIIRIKDRLIFNPANFGIILAGLMGFGTSWWGSYALIPVVIFGVFVLYRVSRAKMAISFLVTYAFFTSLVFGNMQSFLPLITNSTLLFFAFFMLTEHKTSPFASKFQIIYGAFTGALSALLILVSQHSGITYLSAYHLNVALAFGNILAFKIRK